jgi:cytochrome b
MVESKADERAGKKLEVVVWDLPVRIVHWLLAALVISSFWTGGSAGEGIHPYFGFAILALVLFRIIWGFVGSETARFSSFVRGPGHTLAYGRGLFRREAEFHMGHNPLGGVVILAMLGLLLVQGTLGLFTNDEILFQGPLANLVSEDLQIRLTSLHRRLGTFLMVLVALHVAASVFYLLWKRTNLVTPMLTGRKRVPEGPGLKPPAMRSAWLAFVLLAVCAGVVYAVVS